MSLRRVCLIAALACLAVAWLGPLPMWAAGSFAAHMVLHMLVVAVAAPLLAVGLGNPARRLGGSVSVPMIASLLDFVVIWGWHAPLMHHAARGSVWLFALEQASFLGVGVWVWLSALSAGGRAGRLAGAVALFFTAMHMTLLGALIGLAARPVFAHGRAAPWGLTLLDDQHLGGVVMLAAGGIAYLAGALVLVGRVLHEPRAAAGEIGR